MDKDLVSTPKRAREADDDTLQSPTRPIKRRRKLNCKFLLLLLLLLLLFSNGHTSF